MDTLNTTYLAIIAQLISSASDHDAYRQTKFIVAEIYWSNVTTQEKLEALQKLENTYAAVNGKSDGMKASINYIIEKQQELAAYATPN